jgi:casein kinase I family protein HRR25
MKKQECDHITEKKIITPTDLLCHEFPNEFGIFLNYTHTLHFDDKPDYSYLHKLFHDLLAVRASDMITSSI